MSSECGRHERWDRRVDGEECKDLFVESEFIRVISGFRTLGRRDVGKALVQSHEVAFKRDDAEINSNCKVP
jgi:hypothetical protein